MIYVGIDDTDVVGSRGTNQLARWMVTELAESFRCLRIVRHQLLEDPRVPCTTKNGSASILFERRDGSSSETLTALLRQHMLASYVDGSDPGLCVTEEVPAAVVKFGRRCQTEFVSQLEAYELAAAHGLFLEGLGGTRDGVIGALAAVGLATANDDGRIVQLGEWPDDVSGVQPVSFLLERGLHVWEYETERVIETGRVDVGKHLRPNRHQGRDVLFVRKAISAEDEDSFVALKLP